VVQGLDDQSDDRLAGAAAWTGGGLGFFAATDEQDGGAKRGGIFSWGWD
jgi:hypothetical protein